MKKIYLLLCFVACLLASCLEDKGNDLYIELIGVTIGKIRDSTVEQFNRLKMEPVSSKLRIIPICGICIQLMG